MEIGGSSGDAELDSLVKDLSNRIAAGGGAYVDDAPVAGNPSIFDDPIAGRVEPPPSRFCRAFQLRVSPHAFV